MDERSVKSAEKPNAPASTLEGSIKDTIESILVAFMLAFIFRAFVVEAFVIPTGSMAPTLLGAHMRFRCSDCGYRFHVNFPTNDGGKEIDIPPRSARSFTVLCPNCGYRLPDRNPLDPSNESGQPPVHYGDRILVLKYLYLFQDPKRWDVVVFKSPVEPREHDYSQNYIKRLVGKPGESVMILDGDVYVGQGSDIRSFKVQSKPPAVQEALWRIVYDNDYHPRGLPRTDPRGFTEIPFTQPWKQQAGGTGWKIGDGAPGYRDFIFDNPSGRATLAFDPSANPKCFALTDWIAYDVTDSRVLETPLYDYNVSDVKLSFFYQRTAGEGPLRVELTKFNHKFEAMLTPDSVALLMDGQRIGDSVPLERKTAPIHVEMSNVDYRVSIWIDGKEVLATTAEQYQPDMDLLLEAFRTESQLRKAGVRIIGEQQTATLSHIGLWRDIYYLNRQENPARSSKPMGDVEWAGPARPAVLEDDQYFVMGDNSLVSLDARFWKEPIKLDREDLDVKAGVVPGRFMLGKAFFVYWPAGYRPVERAPALAPNFGDMRFIH